MSSLMQSKALIGLSAAAGISLAAGLYYWNQIKSNQVPPTEWRQIGSLEEICIFPIKSCGAIEMESANCEILGIAHNSFKDRMFMLINEDEELVSLRTYPKMLKIQPKVVWGQLIVSAPNMSDLKIDFNTIDGQKIKIKLWGTDVFVTECGEQYHNWFSRYILEADTGIKLVYYPYPIPTRPIVGNIFKNGIFLKEDTGTLQDVSSYMLIHQNSVEDLNNQLEDKSIHHRQFRGNFVIKTSEPAYSEDNWQWIRIGDEAIFRSIAPCYRCIVPNVNLLGERDPDNEPLQTLKSYRVWGKSKSPRMGLQLGLRNPGVVKKGDPVYIEAE